MRLTLSILCPSCSSLPRPLLRHVPYIQAKKFTTVKLWRPKRSVPINFIFFWWVGVAVSLGVMITGCVYLANQDTHPLNLDVDFTAGTALDLVLPANGTYTIEDVTSNVEDTGGHGVATAAVGPNGHVNLRFDDVLSSYAINKIVVGLKVSLYEI